THTQFQVILKPDPGNPQELYLGSLQALGIDIASHDVRFVEDNWTSPALGAWGFGWEVWLDGLEITQFTYFQQAGGVSLDPVSVELTYGMERIIMALQGVRHFKEITYAPGISYGEVFGQAEYELSRYYLDDADIEANQKLFQIYAQEAERLIELRLPIPAHSYVLKCSHTFNILDSRGAISTTERARAFARMRGLAQQAAKLWLERRQEIGHPLGVTTTEPTPPPTLQSWPQIESPSPLVFEIGVEEMPPAEVTRIVDVIRASLTEKLAASRLKHGLIEVFASPRRIVACIADVAPAELDYDRTERGPRLTAAFDQSGAPTKAAIGFARSKGIEVEKLQQIQIDDAIYVGLVQRITGRPAAQVLSGILPEIVTELRSEKNMRWGAPGLSFTRPIRWLLALLGEQVVPFTVSTLTSGRTTHVHRFAAVPVVEVTTAADYLGFLRGHGIIADPAERRQEILRLADELAASVNGKVDLSGEAGVIDEIVNLVEQPTPILGHFDQRYLELPGEILTTVMKKHQRYLPLRDHSGQLLPHFLAVANGSCDHDLVRSGNEAVLRARYEDARFFWQADLKTPPELMKQGLIKLTFESRLGSIADRAQRIEAIANQLATPLPLTNEETRTLTRAGQLAKFDLGSNMVVELTSLAGIMAREYAIHAHESESVAQALYEMELPRQAGDRLPSTLPGAILALADRFDLLTGLFAINAAPTGSSDPFGLRRAALGVTSILLAESRLASIGLHKA
ncbi:MAG: glycine--tRNA ligase subunit beta, partial [Candidatus Dormibacteraceae bacterium]